MILGHNHIRTHLETALSHNRLHHAYLFSGVQGIGKAGLTMEMLPMLLGAASNQDPTKLLHAGAHPDFLYLSIEADEKTGKMRSEITRSQVEGLLSFLTKHAVLAKRKVVVIDCADDLNINASNNLLKWLEEPRPNTCIILISHRPSALLPTIRSRCAALLFRTLNRQTFDDFAKQHNIQDLEQIFALSGGVPGDALTLTDPKILEALSRIRNLIENFAQTDALKVSGQARELLISSDIAGLSLSLRLLRYVLRERAGQAAGSDQDTRFAAQAYALTQGRDAQARKLNIGVVQVWTSLLLDLHALAVQVRNHAWTT